MPAEQARALIAVERGRKFDPDVVDAFVNGFDAFRGIAERYADPPKAAAVASRN